MNKYKIVETFFQGIVHYKNNKKKHACIIRMNKKLLYLYYMLLEIDFLKRMSLLIVL